MIWNYTIVSLLIGISVFVLYAIVLFLAFSQGVNGQRINIVPFKIILHYLSFEEKRTHSNKYIW